MPKKFAHGGRDNLCWRGENLYKCQIEGSTIT